jgi:hypothetical protein
MASKGFRVISYQVTQKLERATTLRIQLKPLLAIPCVGCRFIKILFRFKDSRSL